MRRSSHRTSHLAVASLSMMIATSSSSHQATIPPPTPSSSPTRTTTTPSTLLVPLSVHMQIRNCTTAASTNTITSPPPPPKQNAGGGSGVGGDDVVVDIDTHPITGVYGTCLFGLETLLADYAAVAGGGSVKSVTVYTTLVHKSVVERSASAEAKRGGKGHLLDASARRKSFKSNSTTNNGSGTNIKGGGGGTAVDPSSMPSPDQPPTSRTISSKAPLGDTIRVFTLHSNGVVLDGKRFPVVPAYTFQPTLRYPTLEPPKMTTTPPPSSSSSSVVVTSKTVGPRVLSPGTKHAEVVVFKVEEYRYEDMVPEGDAADTVGDTKAVHSVGVFAEGSVVGFGLPDDAIQSLLSLVLHPYADPKDAMLVPKPSTVRMHNLVYRVPTAPPPSPYADEVGVVAGSQGDGENEEKEPSSHVLRSAPALLVKSPLSGIPSTALSDSGLWGLARRVLREQREEAANAASATATSSQEALHGRKKDRTFYSPSTTLAAPSHIVPHILSTSHVVVRSRFAMLPSLPKSVVSFLHGKRHQDGMDTPNSTEDDTAPTKAIIDGGAHQTTSSSATGGMTSEEEASIRGESTITTHTRPHSVLLANSDPMTVLPYMFGIHEVVLLRGYNALVLPIRSKVASWQHHVSRTGALPMSLKEARVLKASLLRISSRQAKIANTRHKILWEERHVHARQQFLATGDHFEMGAASEELKHRNEVLQSSVAYLCDQAHQEKDYYLEYIIILLIMVEVYLAMVSHGLGLWDDEEGSEGTFGGGGHHPKTTFPHHQNDIHPTTPTPLPVVELPLIPSLRCHGGIVDEGAPQTPLLPTLLPASHTTTVDLITPLAPPTTTPPVVNSAAESSEPIQAANTIYVSTGQYTVDNVCASVLDTVVQTEDDAGDDASVPQPSLPLPLAEPTTSTTASTPKDIAVHN